MEEHTRFNEQSGTGVEGLRPTQPYIHPSPSVLSGYEVYADDPVQEKLLADATVLSAVLVNAADRIVDLLKRILQNPHELKASIVLVLAPACGTRQDHLEVLLHLLDELPEGVDLKVRLLHWHGVRGTDTRMDLPPTTWVGLNADSEAFMAIGSYGDGGHGEQRAGAFNMVFQPEALLLDEWRKWFQYTFSSAVPLTAAAVEIPYLVPPQGDPEANRLWQDYLARCTARNEVEPRPKVDIVSGEVKEDAQGQPVEAWDGDRAKLNALALELQRVYASGYLVTVDETTRIKPFSVPLNAALMGQRSERKVGGVTQKQFFSLQVLDKDIEKGLEGCRKITDLVDLLSYPMSKGNRWLPKECKSLLEQEIERRNAQGLEILKTALGGKKPSEFIEQRLERIRRDVDDMYRTLGMGDRVPEGMFQEVRQMCERRLGSALETRITPRAVFNRISAPDLRSEAPDEHWNQPLALLTRSATMLRKYFTDAYMERQFRSLAVDPEDFLSAMDVFKDKVLDHRNITLIRKELAWLKEHEDKEMSAKERYQEVWKLIKGEAAK